MHFKEVDSINRNYRIYSVLQFVLAVAIFGTVCFLQSLLRRLGHPAAAARLTEHMVRKAAHFCEYTMEGFFLLLGTRLFTHKLRFLSWPVLLGLLTALCDETIQLFYAGRGSSVTDVWIDFAGVLTGMALAMAFAVLVETLMRRTRRREEKRGRH